ncbi:MAG: sulfotransferase family 2 domain-containing protein [Desulfovibrio sp.]|nr:sulfotransferase family 2 domain-containing protein [Desulfovibrio sp.]
MGKRFGTLFWKYGTRPKSWLVSGMTNTPLFFLHFPRTAGTTVDDIFFNNIPENQILKIYSRDEFNRNRFIDETEFYNLQYITGHLLLSSLNPTQIYGRNVRAFTFLRNPVKRLYSEYIFLKTWKEQHLYEYLNTHSVSFTQYITSTEKILKYRGKNFMTRCLSGDSLENGNIKESLEKAKSNLKNSFIFFGIQERFMESIFALSKKIGLKNIIHQKRNALNYSSIPEKISPEEEEIAREYNSADIELYNFARDIFEKRIKAEGAAFQAGLKNYLLINSKFQNISNLLYKKAHSAQNNSQSINLPKNTNW